MARFNQFVAILSGFGLLASVVWHGLILAGQQLPQDLSWGFIFGMFAVWIPVVMAILPLRAQLSEARGMGFYNVVFVGAPLWMRVSARILLGYVVVNFVLATGMIMGSVSNRDPAFQRVTSGFAMAVYAIAMTVLRATVVRDGQPHCYNGHRVPEGQHTCPVCGARVIGDPSPVKPGA